MAGGVGLEELVGLLEPGVGLVEGGVGGCGCCGNGGVVASAELREPGELALAILNFSDPPGYMIFPPFSFFFFFGCFAILAFNSVNLLSKSLVNRISTLQDRTVLQLLVVVPDLDVSCY